MTNEAGTKLANNSCTILSQRTGRKLFHFYELLVGGINSNHVLRDVSATNIQFSLRFLGDRAVTDEALDCWTKWLSVV